MLDAKGEVLYVGKAKRLKARVGSYARGEAHSNRIARMIAETAAMEFVTTATETEALLLEANLIKQLRPRYNVLLRDDKSLPYILLTGRPRGAAGRQAPRRAQRGKGDYFGPFANVWAVNRTINALQRAFLLRSCNDSYYENRTRPCLLFQIKRCSGPCTERDRDPPSTRRSSSEARAFLVGQVERGARSASSAEMQEAAENLEFERAARYRDRLAALSAVQGDARDQHAVASRRRTCSRSTSRPGSSASRCSSSATGRTGATGPTSRRPTSRCRRARCWRRSSPSSTTTSRRRA